MLKNILFSSKGKHFKIATSSLVEGSSTVLQESRHDSGDGRKVAGHQWHICEVISFCQRQGQERNEISGKVKKRSSYLLRTSVFKNVFNQKDRPVLGISTCL